MKPTLELKSKEDDNQKLQTIQELIQNNLLKEKQEIAEQEIDAVEVDPIKQIKFSQSKIDTNGIEICLLDDLTS